MHAVFSTVTSQHTVQCTMAVIVIRSTSPGATLTFFEHGFNRLAHEASRGFGRFLRHGELCTRGTASTVRLCRELHYTEQVFREKDACSARDLISFT